MRQRWFLTAKPDEDSWGKIRSTMESAGYKVRMSRSDYARDIAIEVYSRQLRGPLGRFRRSQWKVVYGRIGSEATHPGEEF